MTFERITTDPEVLGGVPCIRGLRVAYGNPKATYGENLMSADTRDGPDLAGAGCDGTQDGETYSGESCDMRD